VLLVCLVLWYAKYGNVYSYHENPHCTVISSHIHDGHTILFNFELICLCLFFVCLFVFGLLFDLPYFSSPPRSVAFISSKDDNIIISNNIKIHSDLNKVINNRRERLLLEE
jgi:hypothetical protein